MGKEDIKPLKIVFFGTPEFAVESLRALIDDGQDIAAVVTMPDKIGGRGHKFIQSDVKKFALEKGLRVLQPEKLKSEEFINELRTINADLFIVIAFRMLPEIVWQMPRLGTFNLHASLLPKYRGAAPINRAVMNGETETGVTTFFLKHEIDTGDIIEQKKIDILPEENVGDVHDKLMSIGAEMVVHTVREISKGKVKTMPQPEGEFIPAPKIFSETCQIDWKRPAVDIHNQIRGLSPYPGSRSNFKDSRTGDKLNEIKIFQSALEYELQSENIQPGDAVVFKDRLFVVTGEGMLEILSVQPAGKKRMEVSAFLRGYNPTGFV